MGASQMLLRVVLSQALVMEYIGILLSVSGHFNYLKPVGYLKDDAGSESNQRTSIENLRKIGEMDHCKDNSSTR